MLYYKAGIALLTTTALALPRTRRQGATCALADLSSLPLPTSTLPNPANLTLSSIVIGRGVQNYTCADPAATPVANGALAILYDASCVAISDDTVFDSLTTAALALDLPANADADLVCDQTPLKRSGHHFFNAAKVPVFDLSESAGGALGVGLMAVQNRSPAPNTATDVPWLELGFVAGTQGPIQAIYRVQTRGGQPPATCEGVQGTEVSSQYSAEYWIFTAAPIDEDDEPPKTEPGDGQGGGGSETTTTAQTPATTAFSVSVTSTPLETARPTPPSPPRGPPVGPPHGGRPPLPNKPVGGFITRPTSRPRMP